MLTSLDGGGVRDNTDEVIRFVDVAVVSERMCEQMNFTPAEMLEWLKGAGCKIGGVTLGERGMVWYDEKKQNREQASLAVPKDRVIDTNGAGDIFHGAYVYSYLARPDAPWEEHFHFARGASAHSVQHLGLENSLPTAADIEAVYRTIPEARAAA